MIFTQSPPEGIMDRGNTDYEEIFYDEDGAKLILIVRDGKLLLEIEDPTIAGIIGCTHFLLTRKDAARLAELLSKEIG